MRGKKSIKMERKSDVLNCDFSKNFFLGEYLKTFTSWVKDEIKLKILEWSNSIFNFVWKALKELIIYLASIGENVWAIPLFPYLLFDKV